MISTFGLVALIVLVVARGLDPSPQDRFPVRCHIPRVRRGCDAAVGKHPIQRTVAPVPYHLVMTNPAFLPSSSLPGDALARLGVQPPAAPVEVFVSHATRDERHVGIVKRRAEALGITVCLAEHDVQPGAVLAEKVDQAIRRCQAVIVLITTASIDSAFVHHEIGLSRAYGKPLIPMVEKGIDTGSLGILAGVEYLDLDLDPERQAETLAKMTAALQRLVMAQIPVNVSVVSVTQTTEPDPATALALIGLGLILGVLIMAALSNGGGGGGS